MVTCIKSLSQRSLALCNAQSPLPPILPEIIRHLAPSDLLLHSLSPTFHRTSTPPSPSGKNPIENLPGPPIVCQ